MHANAIVKVLLLITLVAGVLLRSVTVVHAAPTLFGDSVQASFSSLLPITKEFTSPAPVGAGIEFTGQMIFLSFGETWDFFVDIGASDFKISLRSAGANGHIFTTPPGSLLELSLSDLDFNPATPISRVINSGYSCNCAAGSLGPTIFGLSFTANSINVSFDRIRSGDLYTFDVNPVPEPSTWLLFSTGLVALLSYGWRQRTIHTAASLATLFDKSTLSGHLAQRPLLHARQAAQGRWQSLTKSSPE